MRIFITGMTGTLGTALAKLHLAAGDEVFGCARNEHKIVEWKRSQSDDDGLWRLVVADAIYLSQPHTHCGRLLPLMDRVYHCAAMKHVDLCEANPAEAVLQNIDLTRLVASACEKVKVPLVFVSTDKAFNPSGVYGATKLIGERIVVGLGGAVVRLGNLIGSSGSVFQLWKRAIALGEPIRLTDPDMTRYFIPVDAAARFLSSSYIVPGRVVFPTWMKAVRMGDIAASMTTDWSKILVTGQRPGETKHQWLSDDLCSETAPKWDVVELLKHTGVE